MREGVVEEFVNASQQYYKDGSNGTWDCRWFAGFHIVMKIMVYVIFCAFPNGIVHTYVSVLFIMGASIVVVVEPYKEEYRVFNKICPIFLLWQTTLLYIFLYGQGDLASFPDNINSVTMALGAVPLLYIVGVALHHLFKRFRRQKHIDTTALTTLPDRLLHSDQYRDSFLHLGHD
jgi:hypothetical protein